MVDILSLKVVKRGGNIEQFDVSKIVRAIGYAAKPLGYDLAFAETAAELVVKNLQSIQDPGNELYKLKGYVHPNEIDFELDTASKGIEGHEQDFISASLIHEGVIYTLKSMPDNPDYYRIGERYGVYMRGKRRAKEFPDRFHIDWVSDSGLRPDSLRFTHDWYRQHNVMSLEMLMNQLADDRTRANLITASEERYERQIHTAAQIAYDAIREGARLIVVAGPSSSSKTTSTHKICNVIDELNGKSRKPMDLELKIIGGDHAFYGLENHPELRRMLLREDGSPWTRLQGEPAELSVRNYETVHALRRWTLTQSLFDLLEYGQATVAQYDMKEGKPEESLVITTDRSKTTILIFDSLHGLDPIFYEGAIKESQIFKIYVDAIYYLENGAGRILDSYGRLVRRIFRDLCYRNKDVFETIMGWPLQERGVEYIRGMSNLAHVFVNGGHPYDIPVLSSYIMHFFRSQSENGELSYPREWFDNDFFPSPDVFANTPGLEICHNLISGLYDVVQSTAKLHHLSVEDYESGISRKSNIREFIGGLEL